VTRVRTRAALVAAATLTGLLVAPTGAHAVVEMCQGLPPTIVADPNGGTTTGTQGDDVIVSHQSGNIDAMGGDDVICLDSGDANAGDGDDSILVTATDPNSTLVEATLGAGDDRYVGGPGQDFVDPYGVGSPGSDNVSTGAGNDSVDSWEPDEPNHDVVDLGTGNDFLNLSLRAGSLVRVQAGNGVDSLNFTGDSGDYTFDLGTGVVTGSGVERASLSGIESFGLFLEATAALRVLGTPGRDVLGVVAGRLDLHLGDGRDVVRMGFLAEPSPVAGVLDLGPGEDSVDVGVGVKQLVVGDFARGRLVLKKSARRRGELTLLGAERLRAWARRVVLRGGPGADRLSSQGCDLRISGGAGADRLSAVSSGLRRCGAHVTGGAGRDSLSGGWSDDELVGGPGSDEALGRQGTDTCRAERETSCEL
jgi:Ca2+-binding RTX toxin-like protein